MTILNDFNIFDGGIFSAVMPGVHFPLLHVPFLSTGKL
jgi:hypothetical protein